MKRTFLLFFAVLVSIVLAINSTKRILGLRTNSLSVGEAEKQLEKLKQENEALKGELEYKKTDEFVEEEIRNKLGLAREGETVVILPKENDENSKLQTPDSRLGSNWEKWQELFFGSWQEAILKLK